MAYKDYVQKGKQSQSQVLVILGSQQVIARVTIATFATLYVSRYSK
jgi:hypothetical protein